jgi:hypothetical protein
MASTTHTAARGFRLRDLVIGIVVLMIGGAMLYTVLTNGAGAYNYLAIYAFAIGGSLLATALIGGAMIDRVAAKHPSLAKPHQSPLVFAILAFIGAFGLIYAWMELRDTFDSFDLHSMFPW